MQKKVKLPSGAELVINDVIYDNAKALKNLVSRKLVSTEVALSDDVLPALLSGDRSQVLAALGGSEVNSLKNLFFGLVGDDAIEDAVIRCMERWVLNGEAVKAETFHPKDRRGDLIPCAVEVAKEAVLPFFAHLGSSLSGPAEKQVSDSPK